MAPKNVERKLEKKNEYNKGAWSSEEDKKLSQYTQIHGTKKWNTVAINSGRTDNEIKNYWNSHLSKRLIKNTTIRNGVAQDQILEEQHKFIHNVETQLVAQDSILEEEHKFIDNVETQSELSQTRGHEDANNDTITPFDPDKFFDFSLEGTFDLEWVNNFIKIDK
ncbi:transcription factor WER-like [Impatiens glandulifera]|uniref:transcription factor WER-like n=1 Tax=Impatiens glandulifera TaxID=253017 RepID=UPI001FB07F96|nr:transcription factor WER-like [Impatiens glandulifera]